MSEKIQLTDFDWKAAAIAAMQRFSALAFSSNQNELLRIFLGEGQSLGAVLILGLHGNHREAHLAGPVGPKYIILIDMNIYGQMGKVLKNH